MRQRYSNAMKDKARTRRKSHWRTCGGKARHRTKEAAFIALRSEMKAGKSTLRVYRCSDCKKYHLGNTAGAKISRILDSIPAR